MKNVKCSLCELEISGSRGGVLARNGCGICRTCLDACVGIPAAPGAVMVELYPEWGVVDPEIQEIAIDTLARQHEVLEKHRTRAVKYGLDRFEHRMITAAAITNTAILTLRIGAAADSWADVPHDRRESVLATLIKAAYESRHEAGQCESHGLLSYAARHQTVERACLSAAARLGWTGPATPR